MKAVIGLGNPGRQYERTRHNVGFMVLDALATQQRAEFRRKHGCLLAETRRRNERLLLAKPWTFMNNSGLAAARMQRAFSLQLSDLIVVHDDMDLLFGRLRLCCGGGDGGHRGVASVIASLEGKSFLRVRIGIGRPTLGDDPTNFVLSGFTPEEQDGVLSLIQRSTEAVWCLIDQGLQPAMNKFNKRARSDEH